MIDIKQCFLYQNACYLTNERMIPKGVMVHSTGANNSYVKRYVQPSASDPNYDKIIADIGVNKNGNSWNRAYLDVCVHAFIGKNQKGDVVAYQTLPLTMRGWHAGSGKKGSANDGYLSFEMCEDNLTDEEYFMKVMTAGQQVCAIWCYTFGLNPLADNVIICHQDGYKMGIASNHGDIYNWINKYGKSMNWFRKEVQKYYEELIKMDEELDNPVSDWAQEAWDWAKEVGITDGTRPRDNCTREELVTMLYRYHNKFHA